MEGEQEEGGVDWGSAVQLSKRKGRKKDEEAKYTDEGNKMEDEEADTIELDEEEKKLIEEFQQEQNASANNNENQSRRQRRRRDGGKPPCWWGEKCYRKDRAHFRKYTHPPGVTADANILKANQDEGKGIKRKRSEEELSTNNGSNQTKLNESNEGSQAKKARIENSASSTSSSQGDTQTEAKREEEKEAVPPTPPLPKKKPLQRRHSSQALLDHFLAKKQASLVELAGKEEGQRKEEEKAQEMVKEKEKEKQKEKEKEKEKEEEEEEEEKTIIMSLPEPEAPSATLPDNYEDAWDDDHIKFPCSPQNTYIRYKSSNNRKLSRWYLIHTVLSSPIINSMELQEAIIAYNCTKDSRFAQYWEFSGLHDFFKSYASPALNSKFFNIILPFIIKIALRLPELFPKPVPLLVIGQDRTVTLSQEQIACLLANAFLCTFPLQGQKVNASKSNQKKKNVYPSFSFHTLFMGAGDSCLPNQAAKLHCVIHYFERVAEKMPQGNVTFSRFVLGDEPDWAESDKPIADVVVTETGLIEDDLDALQVDFANRVVGGGVLGYGCIQEEIRFVINTELIASLLFTARLDDHECLLVVGAERYCAYEGYAKSFRFTGPYYDETPTDEWRRRKTAVVAIDALHFGAAQDQRLKQYQLENILRELNKCYCGFIADSERRPVATGNWGCGAFGGYHDLKTIIQLMAASEVGRPMHYYTFQEPGLSDSFKELHSLLQQKKVTVGDLYKLLLVVSDQVFPSEPKASQNESEELEVEVPQLFNFLFERYDN